MGIGTGTAALIGGVASAGAGLAGSAMQASAAGNAAAAQQQAAQQAINLTQQNAQQGIGYQNTALQNVTGAYSPYYAAGAQGLGQLQAAMAPGGQLTQGWNQQFQAPTAAQAAQMPGYQFALQQGENAIQAGAAAKGNLLSGGTQKALANYATGLASQTYQQAYNNALTGYQTNYATWANNQANLYNRLMGVTGIGQQATQALGNAQLGTAGNIGNLLTGSSQSISNLLGAKSSAAAQGMVNQAQAWSGGLNQAIGGLGGGLLGYVYGQQQQQLPQAWANLGNPQYGAYPIAPDITAPTGSYGVAGVAPGTGNLFGGISLPQV